MGGQGESKTVEIRRIDHTNITAAVKLVTDVFMKFEAPDYSKEGIKSFFDTAINNHYLRRIHKGFTCWSDCHQK